MQTKIPQLIKNQRKRLRDKATKILPYLLELHGHKCYHCECLLVYKKNLKGIQKITPNSVFWIDEEGQKCQSRWATVDHLIRLADGGTNFIDNLVPSCASCNSHRHDSPRDRCPTCGASKKTNSSCKECNRIKLRSKWLIENGWIKLFNIKRFNVWLDPFTSVVNTHEYALEIQGARSKGVSWTVRGAPDFSVFAMDFRPNLNEIVIFNDKEYVVSGMSLTGKRVEIMELGTNNYKWLATHNVKPTGKFDTSPLQLPCPPTK